MRRGACLLAIAAVFLTSWVAHAAEPQQKPKEADFFPKSLEKGEMERWQKAASANPQLGVTFERVEYGTSTFWVGFWTSQGGQPYTDMALYAPQSLSKMGDFMTAAGGA